MSIVADRHHPTPAQPSQTGPDPLRPNFRELAEKISTRRAVVGVIGQGYVGFPLAQRAAERGFRTIGYDINRATVERCKELNRYSTYFINRDISDLTALDVIVIAVPTPTLDLPTGERRPDLSLVISAVQTVLAALPNDRKPRLLLLESTYAPGTTRRIVAPLLEGRQELGVTMALGYSPERIDPGNTRFTLVNTPKVTSGYDRNSAVLTQLFYSQIVDQVVPASSMEAAEATKIFENTFRFLNITLAHEFDEYCERIGIQAREVTTLASSKPFGFMPFYAGAGIGGHCIAEDPYYLYHQMLDEGMQAPILAAAIANHEARTSVIVERIVYRLGGRPIAGARILVLGVSYKPNISDARRSPAAPLIEALEAEGATVDYHDPHVAEFARRSSIPLATVYPKAYDLCVLVTAHSGIDYARMVEQGWPILDTTGVLSPRPHMPAPARPARKLSDVLPFFRSKPTAEAL
jgi:UDP-N-acetyl-D-glucosamine dehydrogenase